MKYLSGDFVAEYNKVLEKYGIEQQEIDNRYSKIVESIVELEKKRLDSTISKNFNVGDKVVDSNGNIGFVKATPIVLNVHEDEDYYGKKYGPNKFFAIKKASDEEAVTCEGMLRMVDVCFETSEIEKDWGHESKTARYYEDELKIQVD